MFCVLQVKAAMQCILLLLFGLGWGISCGWIFVLFLSSQKKRKVHCLSGDLYAHLKLFFSADCSKYLIIAKLSFQNLQLEDLMWKNCNQ